MTELEAINTLLSVIGESPVDSLPEGVANQPTDAALAKRTLTEVRRDVQAEGWSWNTDMDYKITPNAADEFNLPSDTLRATFYPTKYPYMQYVQRGNKVYDKVAKTFKFAKNPTTVDEIVVSELIRNLGWDEIPHAGQQYITIRSARIYSDRYINSNVIYQYTIGDEDYARNQLMRAEESGQQNNMLFGNELGMGQGIGYMPVNTLRYRRS